MVSHPENPAEQSMEAAIYPEVGRTIAPREGAGARLWQTCSERVGLPISRADMVDQLVQTHFAASPVSAQVLVRRFIRRVKDSPAASRFLSNESQHGQYYYMLVDGTQDVRAAQQVLDAHVVEQVELGKEATKARRVTRRHERRAAVVLGRIPLSARVQDDEMIASFLSSDTERWDDLAQCLGIGRSIFYPEKGRSDLPAKFVCGRCVVQDQCLTNRGDEQGGVIGGLSERERKEVSAMQRDGVSQAVVASRIADIRASSYAAAEVAYRRNGFEWPEDMTRTA